MVTFAHGPCGVLSNWIVSLRPVTHALFDGKTISGVRGMEVWVAWTFAGTDPGVDKTLLSANESVATTARTIKSPVISAASRTTCTAAGWLGRRGTEARCDRSS